MSNQAEFKRVQENFLSRAWNHWGDPNKPDLTAFLDEYADGLKRFENHQLQVGCTNIIRRHKYSRWPTVQECIDACNDAIRQVAEPGFAGLIRQRHEIDEIVCEYVHGHKTNAQWRWSFEFESLPLVKQAEAEGWARDLRSFVRRQVRTDALAGLSLGPAEKYLPTERTMPQEPTIDPDDPLRRNHLNLIQIWRREAARAAESIAQREAHPTKATRGGMRRLAQMQAVQQFAGRPDYEPEPDPYDPPRDAPAKPDFPQAAASGDAIRDQINKTGD